MDHQKQQQSSVYEDIDNDWLRKQAALIASGQIDWPEELPSEVQAELARLVISFRRERLLAYLAQSIALDLFQSSNCS